MMKTKIRVSSALLLYFLLSCSAPDSLEGYQNSLSAEVADQLQTEIDNWAKASAHYGVSASVIFKNGVEWISTSGVEAPDEPLTDDHLMWMASITKSMTGAIILGLVSEGSLGLDDPIWKWLPNLNNVTPTVTLRQLLNHTNGLANYTRNPDLGNAIQNDSNHVFTPNELISYVGPKVFDAGERTQYTNTSFVLLGMIAEKATDKPIVELYHQRILKPLNLSEIFLPGFESPAGPVAHAYSGPNHELVNPLDQMSLITIGYSAFGLFSNARTIGRWGHALFGDSFLTEEMHAEMLEFVPAAGNIPGESGAGLGIRKYSFLNREQWGHSGGSPLGTSLMVYDRESGITISVIMNQGRNADHFLLVPKLLEIAIRGQK